MGAYSAGYGLGSAYKRNPAPAPAGFDRTSGLSTVARYNPPSPAPFRTFATLTRDFTALDSTKETLGAAASITGGQLVLTPNTGYTGSWTSINAYSLVATEVVVELVQSTNVGNGGVETYLALYVDNPNGNAVLFDVLNGRLYFQSRVAGVTTEAASNVAYNATAHRWLRIRESAGTVYWDTSPDRTTWTNQASWVPTFPVNALFAILGAGYFGTEPTPGTAVFDNVNQAGTPSGSGVGSWSFAGVGSGVRTPKASGIGTWTFAGTGGGKRTPKATGSGAFTFTGTGAGKRTPKATGVGSWSLTGAGTGTTVRRGTGAGTATWTGTGVGTSPRRGTGSGAWSFVGSGSGAAVRQGIGSGTAAWTGTGTGSAPGIGPSEGSGTGSWGYVGTGSGTRAPIGAGTGLATWVGTGEGAAPALAVHSGTGSGTWAYAGVGSGITGSALRDITLTVGTGRSRTLTASGTSRTTTATGRSRTLTAVGMSRELVAAGASRTLTATPRE